MKSFLNYFAAKVILRNILQNVTIYLFKYFMLHIMIISQNDRFLYCSVNNIFGAIKIDVYKTFSQ